MNVINKYFLKSRQTILFTRLKIAFIKTFFKTFTLIFSSNYGNNSPNIKELTIFIMLYENKEMLYSVKKQKSILFESSPDRFTILFLPGIME